MEKSLKIGFPPNTLTDKPVRLDVLSHKNGVYAVVNKPADMLFDSYLGALRAKSVMQALRAQSGKPELQRLGIETPYSVCQSDYETSGASLFAMNKDVSTRLRNAAWSEMFELEYVFLARKSTAKNSFEVDLPILMHEERPVWLVSHRFGKKAKTHFRRMAAYRDYEIWSAKTSSARPHQVRVHAAESGLKILGEDVYARGGYVYLSSLKGDYRLPTGAYKEVPLYAHLALHIASIKMVPDAELSDIGEIYANAPLPPKFAVMLKKLGFKEDDWTISKGAPNLSANSLEAENADCPPCELSAKNPEDSKA